MLPSLVRIQKSSHSTKWCDIHGFVDNPSAFALFGRSNLLSKLPKYSPEKFAPRNIWQPRKLESAPAIFGQLIWAKLQWHPAYSCVFVAQRQPAAVDPMNPASRRNMSKRRTTGLRYLGKPPYHPLDVSYLHEAFHSPISLKLKSTLHENDNTQEQPREWSANRSCDNGSGKRKSN